MATKQEYDIFISYSRKDREFAQRLAKDLSNEGFEVFIDIEAIQAGNTFRQQTVEAIDNSKAFIVVLSPDSVQSDNVGKEVDLAQDSRRRILPVLCRAVEIPTELRYQLAGLQTINMENENYSQGFRALLEVLKRDDIREEVTQSSNMVSGDVAAANIRVNINKQGVTLDSQSEVGDATQSVQTDSDSASAFPIITSESPILSSLHFVPVQSPIEHRVVPFLPGSDEPETTGITTPWGETLTARKGDFLVSEMDTPDIYWPVDPVVFGEMYTITRPGFASLKTSTHLVPLSDLTGGDPNQDVTIQSFTGPQTARAGGYYLARNTERKLWFIPNGEAIRYLGIAEETVENAEPKSETTEDTEAERARKERAAFERNRLTNNRSQRIYNDRAEGEDQLGIKEEVSALAETLLLREVVPPVAVGIMGGWGSGKSFVMYLIGKYAEETRAKKVKKGWPENGNEKDPTIPAYVGHIYQIHFNAWTYAKSNLWASLMDTIFLNLNRQMQLERLLAYREFSPEEPPPSADKVRESMMAGGEDFKKIYVDNIQIDQDEDLKSWRKNLIYWSQHLLKENMLWNIMRGQQVETLDKLKDTEEQLKQLKARRTQFEKDRSLNEMKSKSLDKPARQAYFQTLKSVMLAFVSDALSETTKEELKKQGVNEKDIENSWKEVNGLIGAIRAIVTTFRTNKIYLIWTLTFLVITFLLPSLWSTYAVKFIQRNTAMAVSGLMTALPIVTPVLMWVRKVISFNLEANKILEGAYVTQQAKYAEEIVNATDKPLPQKVSELQDQISRGSLAAYDALISLLETQAEEQRQWIGPSAKYANLMDFVQSRLDAATYENQLGLMHQVRQDIDELTYSLVDGARPDVFPRGKPRVILYIDDLDRCPPTRVIEVLEAIQLLLSTKLFIVVLGLDTRYVTRALEKEYKEILQHEGDPSGLDYIEKIIQIPYRVRPIESENLQKYLNAQMDIEAVIAQISAPALRDGTPGNASADQSASDADANHDASAPLTDNQTTGIADAAQTATSNAKEEIELPTAVIQFKHEDLLDLTVCCQKIALTPRSIKRLVNVLKLMKIFWFRAEKDNTIVERDRPRAVKQAAMCLLALSSAYPEVMREAFIHLETLYRLGQGQTELFAALNSVKLPPGTAREIAWQLQKYKGDIAALKAITGNAQGAFGHITLLDLNYPTFNLIRSFSFVGDPIYWSEVEEDKAQLNGYSPVRRVSKVNRN